MAQPTFSRSLLARLKLTGDGTRTLYYLLPALSLSGLMLFALLTSPARGFWQIVLYAALVVMAFTFARDCMVTLSRRRLETKAKRKLAFDLMFTTADPAKITAGVFLDYAVSHYVKTGVWQPPPSPIPELLDEWGYAL